MKSRVPRSEAATSVSAKHSEKELMNSGNHLQDGAQTLSLTFPPPDLLAEIALLMLDRHANSAIKGTLYSLSVKLLAGWQ